MKEKIQKPLLNSLSSELCWKVLVERALVPGTDGYRKYGDIDALQLPQHAICKMYNDRQNVRTQGNNYRLSILLNKVPNDYWEMKIISNFSFEIFRNKDIIYISYSSLTGRIFQNDPCF